MPIVIPFLFEEDGLLPLIAVICGGYGSRIHAHAAAKSCDVGGSGSDEVEPRAESGEIVDEGRIGDSDGLRGIDQGRESI